MILDPILPTWLCLTFIAVLTIIFGWLELKRNAKFKAARIIAVILMMTAFAALVLRPGEKTEDKSGIILLTNGYSPALADSLKKANPEFRMFHDEHSKAHKASSPLESYEQLSAPSMHVSAVLGIGVPYYALDYINHPYNFFPANITNGITSFYPPKIIQRNLTNTVEGTIAISDDSTKIFLESPSGKVDSAVVRQGANQFSLEFTPRVNGNLTYAISFQNGTHRESIPFHVEDSSPLRILVLQNYPTFEVQYLKNFLSDRGHQIALRYQLSKDIFRYEYANRSPISINRLTQSLLEEFDLVILDTDVASRINGSEKQALNAAIKKGLGALTLFTGPVSNRIKDDLIPFDFKKQGRDTTTVKFINSKYDLPVAGVRPALNGTINSITSNKTGVLSGYAYAGRGKVGFQLLQETYRIVLSGDSMNYGRLWSPLIEHAARSRERKSTITIDSPMPLYTDEPFQVDVISSGNTPMLYADSIRVALLEDEAIDDIWHTTMWAGDKGWHQLWTPQGDTLNYYVFEKSDWMDLTAASTIKANKIASVRNQRTNAGHNMIQTSYPPVYFFILFVMSAGFLWLAPKL